jgi:hypothetical protein
VAGSGAKSDSQRSMAALRLASGGTLEQAAADSGVSERSVRRWHTEDAAFRSEVDRLRGEIISRACGLMADGLAAATVVLRGLVGNEDARVRLRACVATIDATLRLQQTADILRRLDELERPVMGQGGGDAEASAG